jgi:putative Mg2+ transporter-C (MgtC) family protein
MADALSAAEQVGRVAAAVVAGAVLGLNRNLRGKAAGLRTHALVSLGAALATCGAWIVAGPEAATRVMQGVITGIGFIGAGVILHVQSQPGADAPPPAAAPDAAGAAPPAATAHRDYRRAEVRGLTTAATVWVAAAIGVACGLGLWPLAIVATLLTLLVLTAGGPLEAAVRRRLHAQRAASARRRRAAERDRGPP